MFEKILRNFLEKPSKKKKLIVIYGPTASGKTDMSIEIAKYLDTQIISTDSRQIFTYMDVGTGKITREEMQGVVHHMLDIITPDEKFSVGDFVAQCESIMDDIWSTGKIPMLVGGTGLYIDSLIFERNAPTIPANPKLRAELDALTNTELYKKLEEIDPEYARELHENNRPYVERGIEIKLETGKSKMQFRSKKILKYEVLFLNAGYKYDSQLGYPENQNIIFTPEYRAWLYERINMRVEQMFDSGAEKEFFELLNRGYTKEDFGMNTIGYKEFFPYVEGEISREACIESIQQHSRNYAKRQLTWFKKYQERETDFL